MFSKINPSYKDLGNGTYYNPTLNYCYKEVTIVSQGTDWDIISEKQVECPKEKVSEISSDPGGYGGGGGGSGSGNSGTGSSGTGGSTGDGGNQSGDPYGNLGNIGGADGPGDTTTVLLPPDELHYDRFTWTLTEDELQYLNTHPLQYDSIKAYLKANGFSDAAFAFGWETVKALKDGGEVDFEDNLILSKEFKDNEKLKCVYDKLAGGNSTLFKDTVGAFIDNPNVNLILTIGDCQGGAGACTQNQYVEETGIITIKIENINETPIEIAQMIIHEAIHAELAKYVAEHDSTVDTNDKPRLFELYKFYRESGVPEKHIDHPYMALNYINPIASTLRQFDNNKYPLDYYKSLAWIGLENFDVNAVLTEPLINTYSQYLSTIIQNSTVCN